MNHDKPTNLHISAQAKTAGFHSLQQFLLHQNYLSGNLTFITTSTSITMPIYIRDWRCCRCANLYPIDDEVCKNSRFPRHNGVNHVRCRSCHTYDIYGNRVRHDQVD